MSTERPLRVLYDDQIFLDQPRGGISRLFTELIAAFAAGDHGIEPVTPYRYVLNEHLAARSSRYRLSRSATMRRPRVMRALNNVVRPAGGDVDVQHHTAYVRPPERSGSGMHVTTIVDMIPERFPEQFPVVNPHGHKDRYIRESDAIFCISESTRRDLEAFAGPLDKPVFVTPLAAGPEFAVPLARPRDAPEHYVLFVGRRAVYKNFLTLARAFLTLAPTVPDLHLVCVGGGAFSDDEVRSMGPLVDQGRVRQLDASDAQLPAYYQHAAVFAFPSTCEGFGLPLLEAFTAGCPVVAADIPCFREIAGDAAAYFDALDDAGLAQVILSVVQDRRLGVDMRAAGRQRSMLYSWERTAALTADAYRQIS